MWIKCLNLLILKSGGASQLLDTNAAKALLESLSMDIRSVVEPSYHIAIDQALEHENVKYLPLESVLTPTMNEFFRKSRASFKKILETVRSIQMEKYGNQPEVSFDAFRTLLVCRP